MVDIDSVRVTDPILVVEDDEHIRVALTTELTSHGLRVAAAADGHEALARAREWPRPCLILLDLTMPGMDGWTFRANQLADKSIRDIPVIVLSARGDADRQGRVLQAVAALEKPVDLDRLHSVLLRHLGPDDAGQPGAS
jgi:CheY-like chemotaxis protein